MRKRCLVVESKLQNTGNNFTLPLFWTRSDFLPQLYFMLPCFKGRRCRFSNCQWYCNKLKPEPWCSWCRMVKERRCLCLLSKRVIPTQLMYHFWWNHLLTCPDFANLSAERRHVFISKSVIFKKDRTSKQKLVKEAFKLPLANRELVTETGLSCGSFLTG